MIENCTTLYPNDIVGRKVSEYSDQHSVPLPEDLVKYHEWVLRSQEHSHFTISLLEARMLSWMARMVNAKRGTNPPASVNSLLLLLVWSLRLHRVTHYNFPLQSLRLAHL